MAELPEQFNKETNELTPFAPKEMYTVGNTVVIKSEGRVFSGGNFGDQFLIDVEWNDALYTMTLNKPSISYIKEALGTNMSDWVGKTLVAQQDEITLKNAKKPTPFVSWTIQQ